MIEGHYSQTFKQKLAERRQAVLAEMAIGQSHELYWKMVGQIQGLDEAKKFADDTDVEISGGS